MPENILNLNNLSQVAKEALFDSLRKTQSASAADYLNVTGDTMTGDLTMGAGADIIGDAGDGAVDLSLLTGTFKTPTGAHTIGGNTTIATTKTLDTVDVDAVKAAGIIIPQRVIINYNFNASSVDSWVFIADRAYTVVSIKEIHSVAGDDGGAVTMDVRKVTDGSAPGAAAGATVKEFLSAAFDLKSSANATVTGSLTATAADLNLAAGNKIGINFVGTLATLAGAVVTIELKAI